MRPLFLILTVVSIAFVALASLGFLPLEVSAGGLFLLGAALTLKDKALKITKTLPNGVATVYSDAVDLQNSARGDFLAQVEFLLSAPALVVGDLGDADTVKYSVMHHTTSTLSSGTVLYADILTQTGAGGAGAAAATAQFRLPIDVKGFVGIRAINSGAGDASDKSLTLEPVF